MSGLAVTTRPSECRSAPPEVLTFLEMNELKLYRLDQGEGFQSEKMK